MKLVDLLCKNCGNIMQDVDIGSSYNVERNVEITSRQNVRTDIEKISGENVKTKVEKVSRENKNKNGTITENKFGIRCSKCGSKNLKRIFAVGYVFKNVPEEVNPHRAGKKSVRKVFETQKDFRERQRRLKGK
jgi:Zn finger protein HypA/HybF involved in hydrogenase expression